MSKLRPKRETKLWNLAIVIDFMNADFKAGKFGGNVRYLFDCGLGLKKAGEIQQKILAAFSAGNVMPVDDDVARYVAKELVPAPDKKSYEVLENVPRAESRLYAALLNLMSRKLFWRLRRCRHCGKFFSPKAKQQYCSSACLRKKNSLTAQERVERARRKRRFDEIFPKLVKLQKMKSLPLSEVLKKVPGFDVNLLATVLEGTKPLKQLATEIKYRNRRILKGAKLT